MRSQLARLASFFIFLLALICTAAAPFPASAQTVAAPPAFSVPRGFYDTAFNLSLSSPGATIRYTLDGSTPSPTHGTVYAGPIRIDTTTVVRAIAYITPANRSPVVTHTYIFLDAVRGQPDSPPPGWPSIFALRDLDGEYPADYGMDPEVTEYPDNASKFDAVMKSLPTLSLVTDLPYLWSPAYGIYFNPEAKETPQRPDPLGTRWERPVSLEWINPDGTTGFAQMAGASIDGETSRRPHRQPKKNFRISFGAPHGTAALDFELFDTSTSLPAGAFEQIVLRNGGNRSWSYFDRDQRREADYINDEWARRAWLAMGNLAPRGTYVHLYINGLYWGLYNVTERLDGSFLQSYLGGTAADYDVLQASDDASNSPTAIAGTVDAWNELLALVSGTDPIDNTLYQQIKTRVDVVNLADYFVHAHYIGKTDWPFHNWNAYRARTGTDTRFKFAPMDNDTGLNKVTENTTNLTDDVGAPDAPEYVFRRLTTNPEFRQVLADRLYKHVVAPGGALTPAACSALYSELADIVDQAVIGESARWGDYMRDKYPLTNNAPKGWPAYLHSRDLPNSYTDPANQVNDVDQKTWVQVRNEKLNNYCPQRSTNVVNQYVTNGWYQTAPQPPAISQPGGMINSGGTVTLSNSPNGNAGTIYYTTNGVDPRAEGGALAPGAQNGGSNSVNITISATTTIKARVQNGGNWSPLLEYTFYISQPFQNLVINEIHYNPVVSSDQAGQNPDDFEFIELHNRGGSSIRLDYVSFSDGIYFKFPANTTLGANQYLVLASNAASFQSRYGFAPFGEFTGSLSDAGETITLVDPVGGVIDTVSYLPVSPWPAGANGSGGSLSLNAPALDNSVAANWSTSTITGGTPGAANNSSMGKTVPQVSWANPAPITYGQPLTPVQLSAVATDNGDEVQGTWTYSPPLGTVLKAGNGQVLRAIFLPENTAQYASVNATVFIDVAKAPLTIAADNKVKQAGAPNPPLTATYTGLVNGDTPDSLDVPPTLSTTATTSSPAGQYPIIVSGASDPNYDITFVNGTLTVTQKSVPAISWSSPAPITYGTALSSAQLNATARYNGQPVAGSFSYDPPAGTVLNAGSHTLTVTFTPADQDTYETVTHSVTIDVAKAPLTIRADNKRKQVGTPNPPLTVTYIGFVNGDTPASLDTPVIVSTTATTDSPPGVYPITVLGATDANYAITFIDGTLTITTEPVFVNEQQVMLPMLTR